MKVTFLGTGTSQGVPVIACNCRVCRSINPYNKRLRSSLMIETNKTTIVIDTGPDFRQQMLRERVQKLDAVIFTHEHKDHVAGLDDVRAFNFKQRSDMPIYATPQVQEALKREFHYVFGNDPYPGVPRLKLYTINNSLFTVGNIDIEPIPVLHHKLPVLGFRIGKFAYITDANFIPDESYEKLDGVEYLVLNALRKKEHLSHFTLDEAIEVSQKIGAKKTWFTHISHYLGLHEHEEMLLPKGCYLAYDGLEVEIESL